MFSISKKFTTTILFILVLVGVSPSWSFAQCSDEDYVAVFVLSGIIPDFISLQTEILSVSQRGPSTFPPESEIYQSIMQVFSGEVNPAISPGELIGNMWSWFGMQSSSQSLVDYRDGSVLFAGTVVWMGQGQIVFPSGSSHSWEVIGELAPEPITVATLENGAWGEGINEPTSKQLTSMAVEYLRTTDVFHSFGECGDFVATGWVYTPAVGAMDPIAARLVLTVEGKIGAPWNGQSVPVTTESWDSVKAVYR